MPALSPDLLLESLAEVLQTAAFIAPEPAPPDTPAPADMVWVTLRWSGCRAGQLTLAAARPLGQLLADNILAVPPGTPEAAAHALDALQELGNITAGTLLARACGDDPDAPEMSLPTAQVSSDAAAWTAFTADPHTLVVLAEGHPLAVRLQELPA